jgi:hypothetical protein
MYCNHLAALSLLSNRLMFVIAFRADSTAFLQNIINIFMLIYREVCRKIKNVNTKKEIKVCLIGSRLHEDTIILQVCTFQTRKLEVLQMKDSCGPVVVGSDLNGTACGTWALQILAV